MMNEFTLDELKMILRAVNFYLGDNAGRTVKDRLQNMIDNYCEHKNDKVICDVNGVICADCDQPLGII